MENHRAVLVVYIDLDTVPGAFHELEDARMRVESMLISRVPHYNPAVKTLYEAMKEV